MVSMSVLDAPQSSYLTVSTSSHTKQIPGSSPEEVTLDKEVIVLQHMLHIGWVVDDDTRRQ